MSECSLPQKPILQALRESILAVSPEVQEGIKWNHPSFRTHEYFATFHLRGKTPKGQDHPPVGVILHLGAKKTETKPKIEDQAGLLRWLAEDRAMLAFQDLAAVKRDSKALGAILTQWIQHV
ncbi:MAG: DUF1801 domain-containing protein [Planctomycetes bacterium]|nr:DUF1801 domain-containing protein [Planctomycetota bacterium]